MKSLDMLGKALGSDQALIVYWTVQVGILSGAIQMLSYGFPTRRQLL